MPDYLQTRGFWGVVSSATPTHISFGLLAHEGLEPGGSLSVLDPETRTRTQLRLPNPLPPSPAYKITLEIDHACS